MKLLINSGKKGRKKTLLGSIEPSAIYRLPLKTFGGAFMRPLVQVGDTVLKNQLLAVSDSSFPTCIHAPVSGRVIEGGEWNDEYLSLENDFLETEVSANYSCKSASLFDHFKTSSLSLEQQAITQERVSVNQEELSPDELLLTIAKAGIVGCGGAQFPTHLKYRLGRETVVDTFIVNGVECEPYLTADYTVMNEYTEEVLKGIACVQKIINANEIVIALEHQNRELKGKFEAQFKYFSLPIKVVLVPDTYPQGGELQLIKAVSRKELRKGSVPADYGVIVSNVSTLWEIYLAVYRDQPFIERIISFSDKRNNINENFLVKIGTPIQDIIGQLLPDDAVDDCELVIKGGPMMGREVNPRMESIDKGTGGLLILPSVKSNVDNCIGCGYCVEVCPQQLMPLKYAHAMFHADHMTLRKYHVMECIECAACVYVCPSDIPLLENIRSGKQLLRTL